MLTSYKPGAGESERTAREIGFVPSEMRIGGRPIRQKPGEPKIGFVFGLRAISIQRAADSFGKGAFGFSSSETP